MPGYSELILVPPAQWEVREAGVLGLVGTKHITIHLRVHEAFLYEVQYRGRSVGVCKGLAEAKVYAMMLPAILFDFGMEA